MNCSLASENVFGPQAPQCYGGYDFTLLFEESIMTVGPIGLLFLCLPFRFLQLCQRRPRDRNRDFRFIIKHVRYRIVVMESTLWIVNSEFERVVQLRLLYFCSNCAFSFMVPSWGSKDTFDFTNCNSERGRSPRTRHPIAFRTHTSSQAAYSYRNLPVFYNPFRCRPCENDMEVKLRKVDFHSLCDISVRQNCYPLSRNLASSNISIVRIL